MNQVLMIAYYYPPLGGVGALRPLQFSRYLPEYRWQSSIVSVANDYSYRQDRSLLDAIPKDQQIARAYRIPIFEIIRRFAKGPLKNYPLAYTFLDPQFDWVPSAIRAGLKLSESVKFDAIYATAPPYSVLRVAKKLGQKLNLPILADLRDPFTWNFGIKWPTTLHRLFYRIYEKRLLTSFNAIVTVNDTIRSKLMASIGEHLPPVTVIPNGYDPADFQITQELEKHKFTFGYVGSLYGGLSAIPFFEALSLAIKEQPRIKDDIIIHFMGNIDAKTLMSDAKRFNVDFAVEYLGFRPHKEAIKLMQQSHILLDFGATVESSAIPAKLFEYGASGRPVLSFSKPGKLADFIRQNQYGYLVNWSSPVEGCSKIIDLYNSWIRGEEIQGTPRDISKLFSRRSLTGKLADVLNSLIE